MRETVGIEGGEGDQMERGRGEEMINCKWVNGEDGIYVIPTM